MKLSVLLPTEVLVEEEVSKVTAEAENGSFCLLPRHIDFVAALVPGILSFEPRTGSEQFVAVDEGILVKAGERVMVSTKNAVRGRELGRLKQTVDEQFMALDEHEKRARSAASKIEADLVRKFVELSKHERP